MRNIEFIEKFPSNYHVESQQWDERLTTLDPCAVVLWMKSFVFSNHIPMNSYRTDSTKFKICSISDRSLLRKKLNIRIYLQHLPPWLRQENSIYEQWMWNLIFSIKCHHIAWPMQRTRVELYREQVPWMKSRIFLCRK